MSKYITNGRINWRSNPELRIELYKNLKLLAGQFDIKVCTTNCKPSSMPMKEWDGIIKAITLLLGLPSGKWRAVKNQVAWCGTIQEMDAKPGYLSNFIGNKVAALEAGYLTANDFAALITASQNR